MTMTATESAKLWEEMYRDDDASNRPGPITCGRCNNSLQPYLDTATDERGKRWSYRMHTCDGCNEKVCEGCGEMGYSYGVPVLFTCKKCGPDSSEEMKQMMEAAAGEPDF